MKAILVSFMGIFAVTATITHIWTVIIAFQESGVLGGIVTLILPALAEIYWMFKMWDDNNTYAVIALIHLLFCLLYTLAGGGSSRS